MRYLLLIGFPVLMGCAGHRFINYDNAQEQYRIAYLSKHQELTDDLREIIRGGHLAIGMNTDEVRVSLGVPLSESRSGTIAQWQYFERLLVFREGILIFYQN